MKLIRLIVGAAAAIALSAGAAAQTSSSFGPAIGDDISDAVAAPDVSGASRTIADLSGENGLVLYFNRSVDWCPFCKAQALEVDGRHADFAERGYAVAILTTDSVDTLADYANERRPSVTMLSDEGSAVIRALGLLDPAFPEGHRAHGLPYPTTLVLSPEGTVTGKLFEAEAFGADDAYRERITVDDVLAAIDER